MGSPDERIGTRIGKCEILEILGSGDAGTDYKASHARVDGPVIIRIVDRAWLGGEAKAFFRRAKKISTLKHPNLVRLFAVGEEKGTPFLVLQHIDGKRLDQMLKEKSGLPLAEARSIISKVAGALAASHRKGIAHGHIRTSSIWLRKDGTPKLFGLGLARHPADVKSDIRAVGEVFRRMLGPHAVIPPEVAPLIDKLEDTTEERGFRGMEEVILELQRIRAGVQSGRFMKVDGDVIEPPDDVGTLLEFDVPPELK